MKKQLAIWQMISRCLQEDVPVMLLYVLESKGSSPGRQGFFMAVNSNGDMQGSIGGGIMENKFVEMAKEKLKDNKPALSVRKQVHDKQAAKNQSGMICSGEQTIFIYRIAREDFKYIDRIIDCLLTGNNGSLELSNSGLLFNDTVPEKEYSFSLQSEDDWLYREKLGFKNHLHIIGAGHCALALTKTISTMDFFIHLYDNRQKLPTFLENNCANKKTLLNDYNELAELLTDGDNQYVVVMTAGYRTDDAVIRSLINRQFKYFGVLGSKKKIEKMFADYAKEGFDEAKLKRIQAPVGLKINSQTPEEIAISIAAELIKVKNEIG